MRDAVVRLLVVAVVASLLPTLAMAVPAAAPAPACHAASGAQRGELVELYTSEGCSSCPPADKWFARLAATADPARLSLLAFHVDYWDSIGWPDRFGSAANSARQNARVTGAGSKSVYTPQVMLGPRVGFPWGNPTATAALRTAQGMTSALALSLHATQRPSGLDVGAAAAPAPGKQLPASDLYVALYEDGLSTDVMAGENAGAVLRHERVVRALLGPYRLGGAGWSRLLHVVPPFDAEARRLGLVAFVQSPAGETQQALTLPLAACAR